MLLPKAGQPLIVVNANLPMQRRSSPAGIVECPPGVEAAEPQEGPPALLGELLGLPGAPAPCGPHGRSAHRAFGTWRLCKIKLKPFYPQNFTNTACNSPDLPFQR